MTDTRTRMDASMALLCWQRALDSEIGLKLTFEDLSRRREAERLLYEARTSSGNPDYEVLQITRMSETEIWIVKKTTDMRDVL